MNYDHFDQVHTYWINKIFPNLEHNMTITSFDDYLRQVSSLPSFTWLKEARDISIIRLHLCIDPAEFTKQYKKHCVTYACPSKPEDGMHRIIYQISPTIHIEAALFIWVEKKKRQSYLSMFICYKDKKELIKFLEEIYPLRRTGDTSDASKEGGFGGLIARDDDE